MLQWLIRIPIFKRLFYAFLLATVIPDAILLLVYVQLSQSQAFAAQASQFLLEMAMALVISTSIVVTIGFLTHLTITRPLSDLVVLTERIRKGNVHARVKVKGRDEIAIVGNSMNTMLDDIVRLMEESQGQHDRLQASVERLIAEVSGIGEGDLRVKAEPTSDILGTLAYSFNTMIAALSTLVVHVKQGAQAIDQSTTNIYDEIRQLAHNAQRQMQQTTSASQTIADMVSSSQQAVRRSEQLDQAANETRQVAVNGRQNVQQTMEGIVRITTTVQQTSQKVRMLDERSQRIKEIVDVIQTIATQTNRLALDAAIQAAMAGEHGKGFGAVAEDIRRLAERTKEQTGLITQIVKDVGDNLNVVAFAIHDLEQESFVGSSLVEHTGKMLATIFTLVEQQATDTASITQVVRQALLSLEYVAQLIQQLASATHANTERVDRVNYESTQLKNLAQQLTISVAAFKLPGGYETPAVNRQNSFYS